MKTLKLAALAFALAYVFCPLPQCYDTTNPACVASKQAYENCLAMKRMQQEQEDWRFKEQMERGWRSLTPPMRNY